MTVKTCFKKNCLPTLNTEVTVHFFTVILKYGIKYYKSCNYWNNENNSVKFSRIIENFCHKSWNFGKKPLSVVVVEKLHFIQWNIFEPPGKLNAGPRSRNEKGLRRLWNGDADCMLLVISLTDGSEHQNGGNSKRQRVAARVETENVTCATTNST